MDHRHRGKGPTDRSHYRQTKSHRSSCQGQGRRALVKIATEQQNKPLKRTLFQQQIYDENFLFCASVICVHPLVLSLANPFQKMISFSFLNLHQ